MMYIVLPPDLSRRAVLTLIQYMYTGEATVSNDILQEVLKGGEILKIRGLCKVHSNNENIGPKHHASDANQSSYQSFRATENGGIKSNKTTPRNSLDKKLPDSRSASHILTQQESPVIVMASSNQTYAQQMQQSNSQSANNSSSQQPTIRVNNHSQIQQPSQTQASTIIVKKDVAIDPSDNSKIPIEHYGLVSLQIAAAVKKAQQNNMKKAVATPMVEHRTSSSPLKTTFHQGDIFPNEEILRYETPSPTSFKIFNSNTSTAEQQLEDEILRYTEKKKRIAQNSKQVTCVPSGSSRENHKNNSPKYSNQFQKSIPQSQQHSSKEIHIPEALSFLAIKEEPAEWTEYENPDAGGPNGGPGVANLIDKKSEVITVKPENFDPNDNSMDSETADKVYSPLTCELCNETFQLPADWVRHIESHGHTEMTTQNIPKKRRRVEEVI